MIVVAEDEQVAGELGRRGFERLEQLEVRWSRFRPDSERCRLNAAAGRPVVVARITLPPGVTLDLGGLAKGFAADIVADELSAAGAMGVCVNLGGDLRVMGTPRATTPGSSRSKRLTIGL